MLEHLRVGESKAISRVELSQLTGLNDRAVRKEIKNLIDQGVCICSYSSNKGYFIAETETEVMHAVREDRKRGKKEYDKATKRWNNWLSKNQVSI